ncbi:MAG: hypothetical protein A3J72_05040 [Nitrospirae bacterium RIFCSPHIGHO2_02_FULL_40_19]|nr:MAG: hypothetical protein A3J72_05040 [Nitrospirae bacterium RIFCSPHIGHO2_02_FULL_40_19]
MSVLIEILELKLRELEEDFAIELLFLIDELDLDEEDFELLVLEEIAEDLLELVFLADELELFCEELEFFKANLATINFDLLRVVWHWPSDTLSQPFHFSNL